MIAKQKVCNKQMIAPWAFYQALSHHPHHGYFHLIKVPMTDQAVEIGILVVGTDWCRNKLWRSISVKLTK